MTHLQLLRQVQSLFSGILGDHLLSLSQPTIFARFDDRKGINPIIYLDVELMLEIVDQLEKNGVIWTNSCKIGNITKAFYQVEIVKLENKGF